MKYSTKIEKQNIKNIINSDFLNFNYLKNSTVLIYNSNSFIASQFVNILVSVSLSLDLNIKIIAVVNSQKESESFIKYSRLKVVKKHISLFDKPDFVINFDCDNSNFDEKLIKKDRHKGILFVQKYDLKNKYSNDLLKQVCTLFYDEIVSSSVPFEMDLKYRKIASDVIERNNIKISESDFKEKSFCYITDLFTAIILVLTKGTKSQVYSVLTEDTKSSYAHISKDLTQIYTSSKIEVENSFDVVHSINTDNNELKKLGWKQNIDIKEMFHRLIQDFYLRPKTLIELRKKKSILRYIFNVSNTSQHKKITILGKNFYFEHKKEYEEICKNTQIINNKIVLVDNHGEGFCGNLKYIAEEIIAQDLPIEIIWVDNFKNNISSDFPKQIKKVQSETLDAVKELSSAKVWIASQRNSSLIRRGLYKKQGQFYIQTWHGSSGVKKIGFDIHPYLEEDWMYLAKKDSEMIDFLIANSEFEKNKYRGTFWAQGETLLYGHPRSDIFFRNNEHIKEKVYEILDIAKNKKIILYAPTFRDDQDITCYNMDYEQVIQAFEKKFNCECVFVLRFHPWALKKCEHLFGQNPQIVNGNKYDDMQELLCASDFMITDYSSCIFDFILTKKPAFIYASDIEKYNKDRGFYYPLTETPFSISTSTEEFCLSIQNFDKYNYNKDIEFFNLEKGIIEDGNASKRVVKLIKELTDRI